MVEYPMLETSQCAALPLFDLVMWRSTSPIQQDVKHGSTMGRMVLQRSLSGFQSYMCPGRRATQWQESGQGRNSYHMWQS